MSNPRCPRPGGTQCSLHTQCLDVGAPRAKMTTVFPRMGPGGLRPLVSVVYEELQLMIVIILGGKSSEQMSLSVKVCIHAVHQGRQREASHSERTRQHYVLTKYFLY